MDKNTILKYTNGVEIKPLTEDEVFLFFEENKDKIVKNTFRDVGELLHKEHFCDTLCEMIRKRSPEIKQTDFEKVFAYDNGKLIFEGSFYDYKEKKDTFPKDHVIQKIFMKDEYQEVCDSIHGYSLRDNAEAVWKKVVYREAFLDEENEAHNVLWDFVDCNFKNSYDYDGYPTSSRYYMILDVKEFVEDYINALPVESEHDVEYGDYEEEEHDEKA